jgi:hypothetical protein
MAKRKLTLRHLVEMANGAAETRERYEKYGLWRFARDSQRQEYFFKGIMRKIVKRRKRRVK